MWPLVCKNVAIAPLLIDRTTDFPSFGRRETEQALKKEAKVFQFRSGAIIEQDALIIPNAIEDDTESYENPLSALFFFFLFFFFMFISPCCQLIRQYQTSFSSFFNLVPLTIRHLSRQAVRSLSEVFQTSHQQELLDEKLGIEDGDVRGSANQSVCRRR